MKKLLFAFIPFSAIAQVEPTAAIQAGVNFGTGVHFGAEAGLSINRRVTLAADFTQYMGAHNESVFGAKVGLATFYRDTDGLCPIYIIGGASQAYYRDFEGKAAQSVTPTFAVRVQTYNGYWEAGRQNGYWGFTVGWQFRRARP